MNLDLAIAEWKRANRSLRAASSCLLHQCHADVVSRAYYAVFHAAKAALAFHGGTLPGSHGGVRQQFGIRLVESGLIERRWGK